MTEFVVGVMVGLSIGIWIGHHTGVRYAMRVVLDAGEIAANDAEGKEAERTLDELMDRLEEQVREGKHGP